MKWPRSPRCAKRGWVRSRYCKELASRSVSFDIIRSATMVNAELLNRPGEFGVVAHGARADLITVAGNPLADISLLDGQAEHLSHIMRDGSSTNAYSRVRPPSPVRAGPCRP